MADATARNARLDKLATAANDWADSRTKELQRRVAVAKAVLKGRTGAERLATATAKAASDLLVDEVDSFLLTS